MASSAIFRSREKNLQVTEQRTDNYTSIDKLEKGKMYKITSARKRPSRYRDENCLALEYEDDNRKYYSFLPPEFKNPTEEKIKDINDNVKKGTPPKLCYYGSSWSGHDFNRHKVKIHPHGEGVDEKLLKSFDRKFKSVQLVPEFITWVFPELYGDGYGEEEYEPYLEEEEDGTDEEGETGEEGETDEEDCFEDEEVDEKSETGSEDESDDGSMEPPAFKRIKKE